MLLKKELSALPPLPFPDTKRGKHWNGKRCYAAKAQVVELHRSGTVLIVDVFHWDTKEPKMRFASDGKTFQTAMYPIEVWTQRNPETEIDKYGVDEETGAAQMVNDFLGKPYRWSDPSVMRVVCEYIQDKGYEKRHMAAQSQAKRMQEHFGMYPDLPADLQDYCNRNMFDSWYLFISKIQKHGKRDARCSCCGKRFRVTKDLKHNEEYVCPKCGAKVVCKGNWTGGKIKETGKICVAANVDNQLLLRWVNVERIFTAPEYKEIYQTSTYAYNLYLKGEKIYFYKLVNAPYTYGYGWYRGRLGEQCRDETYIYTNNLREVFGDSYYKVDLQEGLTGKPQQINFCELLNQLKNEPVAEYLFKMGLPRLASELGKFRYVPDNIRFQELYGVGREYIPMFRKLDVSMDEIKVIRLSKRYVSEEQLMKWRALKIEYWRIDQLEKMLELVSFERLLNYLTKQVKVTKCKGSSCLQMWVDYIYMLRVLKVALSEKSVLMPKNIKESHDRLAEDRDKKLRKAAAAEKRRQQAERARSYKEATDRLYAMLTLAPYSNKGYTISLPHDPKDLVREGESLGHCVGRGGYDQQTILGRTCIVFIRKEEDPDKPFYTLEYDLQEHKIRQLYGKGNKSATPDVRKFAESYIRQIKPRAAEEVKSA